MLWRHGPASGVSIWRRGWVDASWSWGSPWEHVGPDWLNVETEFCESFATVKPDVNIPTLRVLLRRSRADDDPLPTLLEVLGLPMSILSALEAGDGVRDWPGVERVERSSAKSAVLASMRSRWADPVPVRRRLLYGAYAVGRVVACVVTVFMTALGIVVIATDGSVVEQSGITAED